MAIVPQGIRPFVKRTSIPAAKAAAQRWVASVSTATNAPVSRQSALKARLDFGRSLSRTTPMKEALGGYSPLPQDQAATGTTNLATSPESQSAQGTQTGLSELPGGTTGAEAGGDNPSVEQYITILSILPQDTKQQPLRVVFAPPALVDFATKAQQSGMINTADLVNTAAQGGNVSATEVENTAKSELGQTAQVGQQPSPQTAMPEATAATTNGEMGGFGESQVASALRRKFSESRQNPFVSMSKEELAHLYDLDTSGRR